MTVLYNFYNRVKDIDLDIICTDSTEMFSSNDLRNLKTKRLFLCDTNPTFNDENNNNEVNSTIRSIYNGDIVSFISSEYLRLIRRCCINSYRQGS